MQEEEEFEGRDLHPSYVQNLADCPPVVISRFLFRIYAFLIAWLGTASVFGIAVKYCLYLLFDEADTDFELPDAFYWMSVAMFLLTFFFMGLAFYFRNSFPANGRALIPIVLFGGYSLGVSAAEIRSRAFLNTIVIVCLIYCTAAILTQQTYFDFRERKPYVWLAGFATAIAAIVTLIHTPASFLEFGLSMFGAFLMGLPVLFRAWQVLPYSRTNDDIANAVDAYGLTLASAAIYFVVGKVLGQTHPL